MPMDSTFLVGRHPLHLYTPYLKARVHRCPSGYRKIRLCSRGQFGSTCFLASLGSSPPRYSKPSSTDHLRDQLTFQSTEFRSALQTDESSSEGGYEAEQEYHNRHSRQRAYFNSSEDSVFTPLLSYSVFHLLLNEPQRSS